MKQIVQIDLSDAIALRNKSADAISCRIADQETLITLSPELLASLHLNGATRPVRRLGKPERQAKRGRRRLFTNAFKQEVIQAVKNRGDAPVASIAARYKIHRSLAQLWFKQREKQPSSGRVGPAKSTDRRRYSAKFKARAVEMARERGDQSIISVAKRIGVHDANLLRWMKKAGVN